MYSMTADS